MGIAFRCGEAAQAVCSASSRSTRIHTIGNELNRFLTAAAPANAGFATISLMALDMCNRQLANVGPPNTLPSLVYVSATILYGSGEPVQRLSCLTPAHLTVDGLIARRTRPLCKLFRY